MALPQDDHFVWLELAGAGQQPERVSDPPLGEAAGAAEFLMAFLPNVDWINTNIVVPAKMARLMSL